MKNIFKWMIVLVSLYFSINWIADNPKAVQAICKKMNAAIEEGIENARTAAKEAADATSQQLDK